MRLQRTGLWLNRDFMRLWTAQAISQFGSRITREGLPLAALLSLAATPEQMGVLTALAALPVLLFGLLAGVWTDRLPRRPILIAADLGRAALLLTIPAAALLGALSMTQLYLVTVLTGALTIFFNVADQSYLPAVVKREHVLEGNSKLGTSESLAEVGGPALAGVMIQWLTAPLAIFFDALSFIVSAVFIGLIRTPEPPPAPPAQRRSVRREVMEGLRLITGHAILRDLAIATALRAFFGSFYGVLYYLFVVRELGVSLATLGLLISLGGVGALVGALLVERVTRRFGLGLTLVATMTLSVGLSFLTPLAAGPLPVILLMLGAAQLLGDGLSMIYMINANSLRQTLVPDALLGRANASMHFIVGALGPVGALLAGALGGALGARGTLLIAAFGMTLAAVWLLVSPVRQAQAPALGAALAGD